MLYYSQVWATVTNKDTVRQFVTDSLLVLIVQFHDKYASTCTASSNTTATVINTRVSYRSQPAVTLWEAAGSQYTSKDHKVEISLLKQLNRNLVHGCRQHTLGYGYNNYTYPKVPGSYSWYLLPASPPYPPVSYTSTQAVIKTVNFRRICMGNWAAGTREQLCSTKELRTASSH